LIAAVVLAAGAATRFGGPKQALVVPAVLQRLARSPVDDVVVVAGAHELGKVEARVVVCPDWERGPGASLRCGLASLPPETEAAIVVLGDGPNLAPEAVERVLAAWRGGAGDVVAAGYGGNRGHPLLLARASWDAIPDKGMRALPAALVPCDDLGTPGDVDTADDLGRLHPPLNGN
jgi:CTP:molybdopterin cytidylyltransferase MocA